MALGVRARMALTTPEYSAQNFDQDLWMTQEQAVSAADALDVLIAGNRMNRTFFASLSPTDLAVRLTHPEYGELTVDWILHQLAGHQIHHLVQLERMI